MKKTRFLARQKLKQATKLEFEQLIGNANLTPFQEKILKLYIVQGFSICKIALSLSCCDSSIKKQLAKIYDKIDKIYTFWVLFLFCIDL